MFRSSSPRRTTALLTAAVAAVGCLLVRVTPASASAGANWFDFNDNGDQSITVGPNALVTMQNGNLNYDVTCGSKLPGGGEPVNDFVYPTTDVYVVPHGSVTDLGKLSDASGQPHTIIGLASGGFSDEVIGITTPTGKLGYGDYDIVFDTCQDGMYNAAEDTLFPDALHVVPTPVIPPVDPALQAIKSAAQVAADNWQHIHIAWAAALGGDSIKKCVKDFSDSSTKLAACFLGSETSPFVYRVAPELGEIKDALIQATANELAHYKAIANDPPDQHYADASTIDPLAPAAASSADDPFTASVQHTAAAEDAEAAVAEGLLHTMERYKGANAAGDAGAALAQAQQATNLTGVLAAQSGAARSALTDLRSQVAADTEFDADVNAYKNFVDAVRTGGFTPDEVRVLRNLGLDRSTITKVEADLAAQQVVPETQADLLAAIDSQLGSYDGVIAAAKSMRTDMAGIATDLQQQAGVVADRPSADAGGPYTAVAGQPVTLDASGSVGNGASITSYDWDVNGDGTFGDATGARPTITLPAGFPGPLAVRVTDGAGHSSVAYAAVTVSADRAPTLGAVSPDNPWIAATTGTSTALSVQAADPDGDPVRFAWSVDGTAVSGVDGPSYDYAASDAGVHTVSVTAGDGTPGNTVSHQWFVAAQPQDADGDGWAGNVDCNDNNPDVHPGRSEVFGNGIDDDCDPGTPDVPTGGVPGHLLQWGNTASEVKDSSGNTFPNVVSVSTGYRAMSAIDTNGEAYVWGPVAADGDGTGNSYSWPHPVAAVGATTSADGVLTGVSQISNDEGDMLALLAGDGSVVGWGQNGNGQLGDGTRTQRLTPVHVLGVGGTGELTGATQVLTSNSESFAVLNDGTVDGWGLSSEFCEGYTSWVTSPFNQLTPIPLTWIGGNVAKVARAVGATLFLKKDGQVVGCDGSGLGLQGRVDSPWTNAYSALQVGDFGPGSGIVDIAVGDGTALALRNDGTVFTWGKDYNGSLGLGPSADNQIVTTPTPLPLPPGPKVIAIDAGTYYQEALRADGTVLVWGYNNGNTGTGRSDGVITTPTPLVLPPGEVVKAISAHSFGVAISGDPRLPLTPPTIDIHAGAVRETDGSVPVTVTLSASLPTDTTVHVATVPGSTQPGADYTATSVDVTIPAGATTASTAVPVIDDGTVTADKTFDVQMSGVPSGVMPGATMATATILEADVTSGGNLPSLSVTDATAAQPATGETPLRFTIRLDSPAGRPVTVDYATTDGSAGDDDYDSVHGTATIPAGDTSATVDVPVRAEITPDEPESFTLTLSQPVNAVLGDATATGTITNTVPFAVTASSVTLTAPASGTATARIPVSVSPAPVGNQTVSLDWTTGDLSAAAGSDYTAGSGTVTLTADQPTATIEVPVLANSANTAVRTFAVQLARPRASGSRRPVLLDPGTALVELVGHSTPPDTVPPVLTGAPTVAANANGWYNADVTVHWTATDPDTAPGVPGTGVDQSTVPDDTTLTGEGPDLATPTYTVKDLAGNVSAPVQVRGINIDRTPPTVGITGPHDGATYTVGGVPAAGCTASDGLSGLTGPCELTVTGGTGIGVGGFTATATATDKAGNTTTIRISWRVTYGWGGFLPPIPAPGHTTTGSGAFAAGSTIPVKFQLTDANGNPVAATASPEWLTPATAGPTSGAALQVTPAPAGVYYTGVDGCLGQYRHNWKTSSAAAGKWWVIGVRLDDGTVHTVAVALT